MGKKRPKGAVGAMGYIGTGETTAKKGTFGPSGAIVNMSSLCADGALAKKGLTALTVC